MTLEEYNLLQKLKEDIDKIDDNTQFIIRVNNKDYKLKDIISLINKGTLAPKIVLIAE